MTADALIQSVMQALRAGTPVEAIAAIESAPPVQRNTQAVQRTLAAAHAQNNDLPAAQIAIQRALSYASSNATEPATHALAGRIALDLKQPANAFAHFELLVQIAPQQMGFWRYLWDAATSVPSARRALQLVQSLNLDASQDIDIAWAVTRTLIDGGRVPDALLLARHTASRHHEVAAARWLWIKRLTDETPLTALDEIQSAPLPVLPLLDADAVDVALVLPELYADEAGVSAWRERYGAGLVALATAVSGSTLDDNARWLLIRHTAFRLAYHGQDDLPLQSARGDVLSALLQPLTPRVASHQRAASQQLRIGFVSKHIRDCTVGQYFRRFFTDLSSPQIAVHIYACGLRDVFTEEVQQCVDQLMHFEDNDSALLAMASAIADDALDVLIYPEIGMEPIIEKLAAMRLVPLQCALWGHPVTSGLPTMDVFFSAAALEPPNAQDHYRERLQLLPALGTCYPTPPLPSTLSRTELGLPVEGMLVVCAQSPFKWRPDFTSAVAEILRQSPAAKLVVFDGPVASQSRVFDDFLAHFFLPGGIDIATRVIRLPQRSRADFIAILSCCDIALDTFGFSGGNTSLDALSVGLPVITLPGEFMRGRQTYAMLKALHPDVCALLIARDIAHYIAVATDLLRQPEKRDAVRDAIAAKRHKLFDDRAPVAALRSWLQEQRATVMQRASAFT